VPIYKYAKISNFPVTICSIYVLGRLVIISNSASSNTKPFIGTISVPMAIAITRSAESGRGTWNIIKAR
jgi:hypothetical protein